MAARCLALLLAAIAVCLIQVSVAASNILVKTMSAHNDDDTLVLTATFIATSPPLNISWVFPVFSAQTGRLENLEFQQTDTFSASENLGRTEARIRKDVALTQNSKVFLRALNLRNEDCSVKISLPTFPQLIERAGTTQSFGNRGLGLTLMQEYDRDLQPGETVTLTRSSRNRIQAIVASPELSKFELSEPSVSHTRLAYRNGVPRRVPSYAFGSYGKGGVRLSGDWEGSDTVKTLDIVFDYYKYRTGLVKIYDVDLDWAGDAPTLVDRLTFSQNLDVLKRSGQRVMRNNSVLVRRRYAHHFLAYDKPIYIHNSGFSINVYGKPTPSVRLYRGCRELGGEEVGVTEVRQESKYQVISFWEFHNATEAVQGSYTVVVTSGKMETREIMSIGTVETSQRL